VYDSFVVVRLIMADGRHTYLLILLSCYICCRSGPIVGYRLICIASYAHIPLEIVKNYLFDPKISHEANERR
jgi:hypothetical protein